MSLICSSVSEQRWVRTVIPSGPAWRDGWSWEHGGGRGSAAGPAVPPSACTGGSRGAPLGLQSWEGKACGCVSGLSRTRQFAEVIFNLFCATARWEMLLFES